MKRITSFIKRAFVSLTVFLAVGVIVFTLVSVKLFEGNGRSFLGYRAFIVLSDSMSKTDFSAGDLIVVKRVDDFSLLKQGDIIAYVSQGASSYGQTVTHKIRGFAVDEKGRNGIITYGTTTDIDDDEIVDFSSVTGKYLFSVSGVGKFFSFFKTFEGYFCCIFLPFVLIIAIQSVYCVKAFGKYKQAQKRVSVADK